MSSHYTKVSLVFSCYYFFFSSLSACVICCLFYFADQLKNSYLIGYDHSLWILYANGMNTHYQTEPHILAGASSPTLARRNMTLPDDSGQNLVEWRFRKEQTRTKVTVFGRKLRVCNKVQL